MAKVRVKDDQVMFHCVACKRMHTVPFQNHPMSWQFNGDLERPTITPSLKIFVAAIPDTPEYKGLPERTLCHVVVTDGMLNYCADCPHELRGQSVPMVDWNED